MGRNWVRLGGENSRWKGFWGRWQANGCFRRCRGKGFCAGGMVARQTAPGCTRCVRTEKGSARTKRARAEAPRTGVYVISAWNVRGTGRTGCNRAQGSFFANETNHANITPESLGIRLGQNVFYGLNRVSPSDLHKPDMLHTVYLGLFKHMMDWIQGFLKKHGRLEAFDEVWKVFWLWHCISLGVPNSYHSSVLPDASGRWSISI